MQRKGKYIYQRKEWPNFRWDNSSLITLLAEVRYLQGLHLGKMGSLGFELKNTAVLETMTLDVLKSTEIEGLVLNIEQVRSSIARSLGLDIVDSVHSNRDVDGVVDMVMDAANRFKDNIKVERLFAWHLSLFPSGRSGFFNINVGKWRSDSKGPMQVVSGPIGKEKIHYQAPSVELIQQEMATFIQWFNQNEENDHFIKAGIAHLWFVTIHPFDDGNGRIARALTEMLLARADGMPQRYYSMSAQISLERNQYYNQLEKSQKGNLDITDWLVWFLTCLKNALVASDHILSRILFKHHFWNKNATIIFNDRQVLMLNKLLDGFHGKLTTSKWAIISKCSPDTALRDIQKLIDYKIIQKADKGGRSTHYKLVDTFTTQK